MPTPVSCYLVPHVKLMCNARVTLLTTILGTRNFRSPL